MMHRNHAPRRGLAVLGRLPSALLFLPLLLLGLLAGSADAQGDAGGKIDAQLFTRVVDGTVHARLRIELEDEWHLYHTDLGHPEAVGMPTTLTFGGEGITWGEPVLPPPHEYDQSAFGEGIFILGHEGSFVIQATGALVEGSTGADASVALKGQVCDPNFCLPVGFERTTAGEGDDGLFAGLAAAGEAADPVPTEDTIERGKADATLYTRVEDGEVLAALRVKMDYGYHLYADELGHPEAIAEPTTVELKGDGIVWGPVHFPEAHELGQGLEASDGSGEIWVYAYEKEVVLHARGTLAEGATGDAVWGQIDGQTCDDMGCIPYTETFVSQGRGEDALFAFFGSEREVQARGTEVVAATEGGEENQPLGQFLLACVIGGLITLLMPCTYPMIPITISFFTKQAESRGGKVLPLSLAYGLGIVVIFALIGAVVGPPIVAFAQHWITNLVIGVAFVYFALVLFGLIDLQPPRWLMGMAGKAQGSGGLGGVFLMGATLVITSFTCTAPIVGSILSLGAKDGDLQRVVLGMAVFGLTMAIPFVALSLLPGRMAGIPRAGQWMNTLKFFLGFIEIAAAMKFFSNMDVALNEGAKWLPYGPFLWAWVAILVVAALYLLGVLRFKDPAGTKIGPVRIGGAFLTLVLAGYFSLSAWRGVPTDTVMSALAPPIKMESSWSMVVDDYDAALALARKEDKFLFVNFTGHT